MSLCYDFLEYVAKIYNNLVLNQQKLCVISLKTCIKLRATFDAAYLIIVLLTQM